ncbi:hypothetical protein ACWGK6_23620 [Streptomyces violaceusniger]
MSNKSVQGLCWASLVTCRLILGCTLIALKAGNVDQGWAAIIGAAVGAAATGGTALAATKLHRRQGRREDYLAFLDAISRVDDAHQKLLGHFVNERWPLDTVLEEAEVDQCLLDLKSARTDVRRAFPRVLLAGVRQVTAYSSYAHAAAELVLSLAERCRKDHMATALPSDLKENYREANDQLHKSINGFTRAARWKV